MLKIPNCKVVYYDYFDIGDSVKRLVKITAILEMQTLKRGTVISCKAEHLDKKLGDTGLHLIELQQIGIRKNIVSCYEVEEIN